MANFQKIHECDTTDMTFCHWIQENWVDIALSVSCVACLTIGALATLGYLDAIGTTKASYLSYGMYGAAALAFLVEIANLAVCPRQEAHTSSTSKEQISELSLPKKAQADSTDKAVFDRLKMLKESSDAKMHVHFDAVQWMLKALTYKKKLEYYSFYFHLSTISLYILSQNQALKEDWQGFLKSIDGKMLTMCDDTHQRKHQLDCSKEFRRLKGEKPKLKIDQIQEPNRGIQDVSEVFQYDRDIQAVNQIVQEAFDEVSINMWAEPDESDRCFVVRETGSNEVLGCIFLQSTGSEQIFVHALARRPSAVRWGITEYFSAQLPQILEAEKGKTIKCRVYRTNTVAINIYKKLGFVLQPSDAEECDMVYVPPKK